MVTSWLNAWILPDPLGSSGSQEPCTVLCEASSQGRHVAASASGTDAHYAFNCAVQDLTPKCMHWITVLGNIVLPSVKRTKEEIRTGKVRQFKARMCLIAHEPGQMATLVVDDHVLFWFRNRFYRANQFAAAFAILRRYSQYPKHLIHHWAFHVWVKT